MQRKLVAFGEHWQPLVVTEATYSAYHIYVASHTTHAAHAAHAAHAHAANAAYAAHAAQPVGVVVVETREVEEKRIGDGWRRNVKRTGLGGEEGREATMRIKGNNDGNEA